MGTWSTNTVLPNSLGETSRGSCVYNGKIYIIGGKDANGEVDTVYEYDPSSDSYTTLSSLGTARKEASIGIHGSTIYVAGGYNSSDAHLATVEKYDILSPGDGWSYVANMPTVNMAAYGAIYGDYFYMFGGVYNNILKYDISENSWSTVNTGGGGGPWGVARTVGDYIWVIGGTGDKKAVRKWNPSTDTWVTGSYTDATNDIYRDISGVYKTKIYITAGYSSAKFVSYDTSTDTWDDTLPDITTGRFGAAGDVVGVNFYVIGGYSSGNYLNKNESYDLPPPPNPGGDINWAHTKVRG